MPETDSARVEEIKYWHKSSSRTCDTVKSMWNRPKVKCGEPDESFFCLSLPHEIHQALGTDVQHHPENIQEHSLRVAMIAHALAIIRNQVFGGDVNPDRTAVLALYHDASEVLTGNLPTPVKYFHPEIKKAYGDLEAAATEKLRLSRTASATVPQPPTVLSR